MRTHNAPRGLRPTPVVLGAAAGVIILACGALVLFSQPSVAFTRTPTVSPARPEPEAPPKAAHVATPEHVRAVYMSQCAAGTPSFRADLTSLIDSTELNAIIIDIRDYTGTIAFPTENPALAPYVSEQCGAEDMKEFIASLHEKGIYVIGRITVFQNPAYTKDHPDEAVQRKQGGVWKDHKGLAFVDVGAKPYWDSVVALSKESYALGFDELNYDYIRFPSDGPMAEADYTWSEGKPKAQALEEFFRYLHENVKPTGAVMSADLFGMTATNADDLGIGQVLERAMPYFDYISPMVYPSHYPSGFHGYKDVNAHAYDIVYESMREAVRRTVATTTDIAALAYTPIASTSPQLFAKPSYPASMMRPWLQDFDYPVEYTPAMVAAQIRAAADAGLSSYLFWDPSNKYSSLRQVVTRD